MQSRLFIISCSEAGMSQKVEEKIAEVDSCKVLEREGCEDSCGKDLSSLLPSSIGPWRSIKVPHLEPRGGEHHKNGGFVLFCSSKLLSGPCCRGYASAVLCSAALCLRFFLLYTAFARWNKLFPQLLEFRHFLQRTLKSLLFLAPHYFSSSSSELFNSSSMSVCPHFLHEMSSRLLLL